MKLLPSKYLLLAGCLWLCGWLTQATTTTGPTVRVMPDGIKTSTKHTAYAWAGNPLVIWGNATWGDVAGGNYQWDFGDFSTASGWVADPRDIAETHTYASASTYYATLTVTDDNGISASAQVTIDVLPVPDTAAQINLAIERGLKALYLSQDLTGNYPSWPAGGWSPSWSKTSGAAQTALSVLAFENRGHLPIGPDTDIYKKTVIDGLNFALWTINDYRTPPYSDNWQDPDIFGLGAVIGYLGSSDESFYPHGMLMMALAAAGPYDMAFPANDPVHNPALNLTVPDWVADPGWSSDGPSLPINGWTYYKVLQSLTEYAAWAQADPGYWCGDPLICDYTQRGGWRYQANSYDSDNSVAQWPVIGLEAAEQWGIMAPAWVKSELKDYWLQHSYNTSYHGWGYSDASLVENAHHGAGLSMMAYVGIPKTDPWYQEALTGLADHWLNQYWYTWEGYDWGCWPSHFGPTPGGNVYNYYAMYGIAKACRIARDNTLKVSEVTQIGTHNWYDEYAAWLLSAQAWWGGWDGWCYWGGDVNTPFALLVLEPTVSSLRPVASIVASPNPVNAGTTVNFNISGSTHQDPLKFLVSWKLIFDTTSGKTWAAPDVSGSFPVGGPIPKVGGYPEKTPPADYDVTAIVQVTDNVGETAESVVTVHITSQLVPPIANAGGPYYGRVGFPVTLDGSGSYDPNPGGVIVLYEWDLDGNGTYETPAAGPTIQNTWSTPYTGQVGLKVTANSGLSSTASVYTSITVCDLRPVSYPLISSRRVGPTTWEYTFKFVIKNVGNGNATAVSAALQNWPAQVTVVDGNVTFGDVAAGATVMSTDTFMIRINRSTPVQNRDLTWRLQFTDSVGTTWTLVNFPLF